jgi:hypothetical protein
MNCINMLEYEHNDDDNNHLSKIVVGPKVIIRRRNTQQEMIGMVMNELENSNLSLILFVNDNRRILKKQFFDQDLGMFRYLGMNNCNDEKEIEEDHDCYVKTEYNPIRLAMKKAGNIQIIFSKFKLSYTISNPKLICIC